MNTANTLQTTVTTESHLALQRGWIAEAITAALGRNGWKSTLIALPLAQASSGAFDFATAYHFRILTAQEVIANSPDMMREKGLIVYCAPALLKEEEYDLFFSCLQTCGDAVILLFLLLTEDTPGPDPSLLGRAWTTDVFSRGTLYEITSAWQQVTLKRLNPLGPLFLKWWRRQHLLSWPEGFSRPEPGENCSYEVRAVREGRHI